MTRFRYCPMCAEELEVVTRDGFERLSCTGSACDYIHWNNPTPVVAAIVETAEGVILVRNHGWPEKWFGLVTGFLEKNEHPETGVVREVQEELGLDGEVVSLVGLYPFERMNQLIIAYHLRAEGEVCLGAELADYRRVPVSRLRPWPFATGEAVRDWLAERRGPD